MYAVKKMERETAWEWGYIYASLYTIQNSQYATQLYTVQCMTVLKILLTSYIMVVTTVNAQLQCCFWLVIPGLQHGVFRSCCNVYHEYRFRCTSIATLWSAITTVGGSAIPWAQPPWTMAKLHPLTHHLQWPTSIPSQIMSRYYENPCLSQIARSGCLLFYLFCWAIKHFLYSKWLVSRNTMYVIDIALQSVLYDLIYSTESEGWSAGTQHG